MDFGRLDSVDAVDFTLPPDPPETRAALAAAPPPTSPPRVLLGLPRWNDKGFVGTLYPQKTPSTKFLAHYATQFESIELNTTFYGVRPTVLDRWAAATPTHFRFCPKFPRLITHVLQLHNADVATEEFMTAVSRLAGRLGPSWMLLPPSFPPTGLDRLEIFLAKWAGTVSLAVEVRHREWFANPDLRTYLFESLVRHGVASVITDVAGRRDAAHMIITAPTVLVRFVGNRHHPTDFTRLDAWADRLADWIDDGLHRAYFFMHQPEEHLNVRIAAYLADALTARGVTVSALRPQATQPSLFG
jgi:uncharacterized protein YecE (DUF72 family)